MIDWNASCSSNGVISLSERRRAPSEQTRHNGLWRRLHRTSKLNMEKSNTTIHAATAFILGSLAGAGIALILAPQSGKRTREDLRYWGRVVKVKSEKAQLELERGVKNLVADVSEKLQNAFEDGKHLTDSAVPSLLGALESGKECIKAEIEKVLHPRAA